MVTYYIIHFHPGVCIPFETFSGSARRTRPSNSGRNTNSKRWGRRKLEDSMKRVIVRLINIAWLGHHLYTKPPPPGVLHLSPSWAWPAFIHNHTESLPTMNAVPNGSVCGQSRELTQGRLVQKKVILKKPQASPDLKGTTLWTSYPFGESRKLHTIY